MGDASTSRKNIRNDETSWFECLCEYVSQSISQSETGKRPALSRKRKIVLNIWQ